MRGRLLAACNGQKTPRRASSGDVPASLIQTASAPAAELIVSSAESGFPSDGVLRQAISGQELVLKFTQSGCSVKVRALPTGKFKAAGAPRDLSLDVVTAPAP